MRKLPIYLVVSHTKDETTVEFNWKRYRLFERLPCEVLLQICQENPQAKVTNVKSKSKSKWRPQPMDTVVSKEEASMNHDVIAEFCFCGKLHKFEEIFSKKILYRIYIERK